jgi:hypothetical protein
LQGRFGYAACRAGHENGFGRVASRQPDHILVRPACPKLPSPIKTRR